ncbi:Translation initiation factor eIF-2B subunit delta [Linum perenne]
MDPRRPPTNLDVDDDFPSDSVSSSSSSPPPANTSEISLPPPRVSSPTIDIPLSRPFSSPLNDSDVIVGSYRHKGFLHGFPSFFDHGGFLASAPRGMVAECSGAGVLASSAPASGLTTASALHNSFLGYENPGEVATEVKDDKPKHSNPSKQNTSKAEKRAVPDVQWAAKAEGSKGSVAANTDSASVSKPHLQRIDSASLSENKGSNNFPPEKDRISRVEKAKKPALVIRKEARNRVELFGHLPQCEHDTLLPHLEWNFFQLDPVHPAVYKVGFQYVSGDVSGSNGRCIAMLQAFQELIKDYSVPPGKALARDLTSKISRNVSFLTQCRPLSISMGNAIRFLKNQIGKLPWMLSESEAKETVVADIGRFIEEKIILADKMIVEHAVTEIRDGDVLLTYGSSSVVEMILLNAHELGKKFQVVVIDSRPKTEGRWLLRKLVEKGLSCTYTHLNAISYAMHKVTRVFLGASAVLSNGSVYSRVGTACIAMVAHSFSVPVLMCCETYKFHKRVQLNSICYNELGDPGVLAKVQEREEIKYLDGWTTASNLQLLNLIYDVTPPDYVSFIITEDEMLSI